MIHTITQRINVCKDFYNQFIFHPQTKPYKERGSVHQTAKNGLLQEIGITLYGHKYSITYDRITAAGSTEQISYINYVIDARVNPSKVIYRESRVLGSATYRKKPAATTLINKSKKHQKTKEQLIAALEAVSKPYRRVDEVRQEHPELEIDKCKKILREMDINLVTLDKNAKVRELPSIPSLLRGAIEKERVRS